MAIDKGLSNKTSKHKKCNTSGTSYEDESDVVDLAAKGIKPQSNQAEIKQIPQPKKATRLPKPPKTSKYTKKVHMNDFHILHGEIVVIIQTNGQSNVFWQQPGLSNHWLGQACPIPICQFFDASRWRS